MANKRRKSNHAAEEPPPKFKVGDSVVYLRGNGMVEAVIVEDRGTLGVGGRRLYGLHVTFENPPDTRYTEIPEEELTPSPAT